MDLIIDEEYKSLEYLEWRNVPKFAVITGPNGSGKSQLLQLIYQTLINDHRNRERIKIEGESFGAHEVTFLHGLWNLADTTPVSLRVVQEKLDSLYNQFQKEQQHLGKQGKHRILHAFQSVVEAAGASTPNEVTREEFEKHFPEDFLQDERSMSNQIAEIFYNYRLSEIELLAKQISKEEVSKKLGAKPWEVLRIIIMESRLPFDINSPENLGIRERFKLTITHQKTGKEIGFTDLSSGERVLFSLVFYLYNSQEKHRFPKLLLMDEPDAHLHPSMSQQFIDVIKNVLVDQFGVRVLMTTHSPSTVILSPEGSLFEMSQDEPRIKPSPSKNHSVSILTSGIVFVGEGTRYILVEDRDDERFYTYVYKQLTEGGQLDGSIPLVFIPVSTKSQSGGKINVCSWAEKWSASGLSEIISGLVDKDFDGTAHTSVATIERYSIENYLVDPIIVCAALIDVENAPNEVNLKLGEEYRLKHLPSIELQKIADSLISSVTSCANRVPKVSMVDKEPTRVTFTNGTNLLYPRWLLTQPGKAILNEIFGATYSNRTVNFNSCFKAFKKVGLIPVELVTLFERLQSS
ncbi:MAG: ATP-binding protein [Verrucomicrobiales bacterium]